MDDLSSLVEATPLIVVEDGQASTSSSCLDLASQACSGLIYPAVPRITPAEVISSVRVGEWQISAAAVSPSSALASPKSRTLMATSRFRVVSSARYTSPIPPSPSFDVIL